jgi:hypothetical protein
MTENTKNTFVVDEDLNHDDLQDLQALMRVKKAISSKKREIKDKDYLAKHPDLQDVVNAHRSRKVKTKKPEKEGGKIQLELQPEPKVKADLGKPIAKPAEVDYDKLANVIAEKMTAKKAKSKPPVKMPVYAEALEHSEDDSGDEPEPPKPTPTEQFNKKIEQAPPKIKHTVAVGGRWF